MRGVVQRYLGLLAVPLFLLILAFPAEAQNKRLIVTKGADYAGFDYRTVKDVTFEACQEACVAEARCKALTFNESAGWCFLKSDFGALTAAANATAARVVVVPPITQSAAEQRRAELDFLSSGALEEADRFARGLGSRFTVPAGETYAALRDAGVRARGAGRADDASIALGRALAIAQEDPKVWLEFAMANLALRSDNSDVRAQAQSFATNGAVNAYLNATDVNDRARALATLGTALERDRAWKPAIKAYRASLALVEDPRLRAVFEKVVAEHGFHIASHEVDADSESPRACIVFSDALPISEPGLTNFVTVDPPEGLSIEPEESQICIDGVKHGQRYTVRVRAGLPSADGETLVSTAELSIFVRDRAPWVGFAGDAYVLPAGPGASIPISSINTDKAEATVYRIGDRGVATAIRDGLFLNQLERWRAEQIADEKGEQVWEGEVVIRPVQNEQVVTAIPIGDVIERFEPGVYVITARALGGEQEYWQPQATQWFIVSDLGLTGLSGNDGVHAIVRSLATAQPVVNAIVRLVAVNNEVLADGLTDRNGMVTFAPGLARGTGGNAPQLLAVERGDDYAFLSLTRSAFDLTDRGVEGRPAPAPIDVYATTERGIYRPSETVHYTALVRDARAFAVGDLPLTAIVQRPDGVEFSRESLSDSGLGGYAADIVMQDDAMRGSWRLSLYADTKAPPLAETTWLVEDFEPERLALEVETDAAQLDPEEPTEFSVAAKYLYGATAPGLTVDGDIAINPVSGLEAWPGYRFGRDDDTVERSREPLGATAETDEDGKAVLEVELPDLPDTTRPLSADLIIRITDTDGRAVEKVLTRPIALSNAAIGIRPLFEDDAVPEGAAARFDVIAVSSEGARIAASGLEWTLDRLETDYQWYRANGAWTWEPITTSRRVAAGTIDVGTDAPARVEAPVEWGEYRLSVTGSGEVDTSSSVTFDAGWYVASAGSDTPDVLAVALDKPAYRAGDVAQLRLEPRFAGTALVMVIDDRVIAMQQVEVPAEGTSVELPVTDAWGPGAYVTASLYRPMDITAKRMPARALGLTWAKVDPGNRALDVSLDLPEESRPRGPLAIPVSIGNLTPGEEAYVTVAAVDLGILNITNYKPPAPDEWYFAQRRLGVEIRDLYGQLIDRMQGEPGVVRSGGDGEQVRLGAPPPTQKLVAFHSGIVRVGDDGTAEVSFDMPDFNGTVRVMAQAWTQAGIGHAVKDVFVRDPVVVTASVPRFLHTGDQSRILIEVNNVAGPAGDYTLEVAAEDGIALPDDAETRQLSLTQAQRVAINVPITGGEPGDYEIRVTLTMPDGQPLPRSIALGVRAPEEPVSRRSVIALAPGASLKLDAEALAQFQPGTGFVTVSAGGANRIDVPALLAALDRYPYGCAEQITSRALPLVYLNDVAKSVGIAADTDVEERVNKAILDVLAKQASSGSFGLWSPYDPGNDLWLDSYVTDFLTRAEQAGYAVPQIGRNIALDNLANRVAYAQDFSSGGTEIAYALYVLARAGRAAIGDLRYYAEAKLDAFSTPLAKAQIGAALSLYGDRIRAERAFRAALADIEATSGDQLTWRPDYGSLLRDGAAVLTLASETSEPSVNIRALSLRISAEDSRRSYTSTQEQAWMLLAARALIKESEKTRLAINGTPSEGAINKRYFGGELESAPVEIVNRGDSPADAAVTYTGVPLTPEPAGGNGFAIERAYYHVDGTPANVATVGQNERLVVAVTVRSSAAVAGRLLVVDRLPAGFEIENPNLSSSGDTSRYEWLSAERYGAYTEAKTDRFVAALRRSESDPLDFTVAYSLRAVSPGVFVHPAATVEDMYRPERRARTGVGEVEVVGLTR
jgi:uncharacterized protein YfaS (alpha-2-macroglobulin family)